MDIALLVLGSPVPSPLWGVRFTRSKSKVSPLCGDRGEGSRRAEKVACYSVERRFETVPSATKTKYLPFNTVLCKPESSVPITRIGPVVYNPSDLILDGKLLNGLCFQVCIGLSMWFIKPRRDPLEGGSKA